MNSKFILFYILSLCLKFGLIRADPKPCITSTGCKCMISNLVVSCNLGTTDATLCSSFDSITGKRVIETFDLSDSNNITTIHNYFSKNVSFVNIYIRNVKSLVTIEENAFWSSVNTTKSLRLTSSSVNTSETIFKAISKLVYLSELVLDDNQIETLPDNAFGNQKHLTEVVLTRNRIRHLGRFAFYPLIALNFLDLSNNLLEELVNNSFAIQNSHQNEKFPIHIRISLKLNQICGISEGAFVDLKRPTNIDLSFNNLTELRPNVFKTFLRYLYDDSFKIIVKGNKIKCDCGLNWIYKNKTIKERFSGPLRCADKRYFMNLTDKDFKNCTNFYDELYYDE